MFRAVRTHNKLTGNRDYVRASEKVETDSAGLNCKDRAAEKVEDAECTGHSLTMLERIAAVCGIGLKLHAEKKPYFDREVALV